MLGIEGAMFITLNSRWRQASVPLAARAQQPAMPVIGYLSLPVGWPAARFLSAFGRVLAGNRLR